LVNWGRGLIGLIGVGVKLFQKFWGSGLSFFPVCLVASVDTLSFDRKASAVGKHPAGAGKLVALESDSICPGFGIINNQWQHY